jgi:cytochrome c-type biogenesis protein CcmH/NrfG
MRTGHLPWHIALVATACLVVYWNALGNAFHLDDFYRVVDNPGIRGTVPWWQHFVDPSTMSTLPRIEQYRPLLPLTLSINYAIANDSLAGYHAGNLLLHGVASVLVYLLVVELWRRTPAGAAAERVALAVALLFAVHPISGILVNYICARDQILMQVFLLASLLAWLRLRRLGPTPLRWTATLGCLAFSLLSKTDAAVAPALVFLHEGLLGEPGPRRWLVAARRALPHAAVVLAFFLYTRLGLGFSDLEQVVGPGSPWTYPLTQARLHLLYYLPHFFWPFPIRQSPQVEPATGLLEPGVLLGIAFVLGTLVLALRARARAPLLAFSILACWTLLAPTSSFLPMHHWAVDYRPYPALPFLCLALALPASRLRPPVFAALLAGLVLWFATASVRMNRIWRTGESLWSHSVRHGGDALAHHNLAMSLSDPRDPRIRAHLEQALRQNPGFVLAHLNLGLHRIQLGDVEAGLAQCRQAVALQPDWGQSHYWLSEALTRAGRHGEALQSSREAVRLEPRNLRHLRKAAHDAHRLQAHALCLEHAAAAARLDAADEEMLFLAAFSRQQSGDLPGAIADYERLLARNERHVLAQYNLGHALMTSGRKAEAIARFEKTLALDPDHQAARLHLGSLK